MKTRRSRWRRRRREKNQRRILGGGKETDAARRWKIQIQDEKKTMLKKYEKSYHKAGQNNPSSRVVQCVLKSLFVRQINKTKTRQKNSYNHNGNIKPEFHVGGEPSITCVHTCLATPAAPNYFTGRDFETTFRAEMRHEGPPSPPTSPSIHALQLAFPLPVLPHYSPPTPSLPSCLLAPPSLPFSSPPPPQQVILLPSVQK